MRILAVDDEPLMLEMLCDRIRQARPQAELLPFGSSRTLLSWLEEEGEGFDVAFLDIEMPGISGIALAQRLKELCPQGNLVFVTGFSQYMAEAFQLHASGYIMKPVSVKAVEEELENLRRPLPLQQARRLRVQTFGNFEVFHDGEPVHFRRRRTKELFAYLIDRRGAGSTMGELISILWEGKPDTDSVRSQLRSLISDLRSTLQALGQKSIIIKRWDLIAVDPARVDCDYYRFLAGDQSAVNAFRGEYMSNYSWAEPTVGALHGLDERETKGKT
ncbi:MAG: response regulator [Ruminiclostridium sp.]|jgi:two-component system LytT family response regulator|nr:response regulator [Ruminiclostridium sp.]